MREWTVVGRGCHRVICCDARDYRHDGAVGCLVFDPPYDAVDESHRPTVRAESALVFCSPRRTWFAFAGWFGPVPAWVFAWDGGGVLWKGPRRPLNRLRLCFWFGDLDRYDGRAAFYESARPVASERESRYFKRPVGAPQWLYLQDVFQASSSRLRHDSPVEHAKPDVWVRCLIGNCSTGHVLDLYGGAGSAAVGAELLGRSSTTIEIDEHRAGEIVRRLEAAALEPTPVARSLEVAS
jgi:hypothetical protein